MFPLSQEFYRDVSIWSRGHLDGIFYTGPSLTLHYSAFGKLMINVFIALNLWRHELQGRTIVIHCVNMAVVNSISSGRSWDSFLGSVARNIWLITATHHIELTVIHIPGKKNISADALSLWYGEEYQGKWLANCFNSRGVT